MHLDYIVYSQKALTCFPCTFPFWPGFTLKEKMYRVHAMYSCQFPCISSLHFGHYQWPETQALLIAGSGRWPFFRLTYHYISLAYLYQCYRKTWIMLHLL